MTRAAVAAGVAVLLLMMAAVPVSAASTQHLSGGGTATISQVAFNVTIEAGGGASGSFNCLMAGRSGWVLPPFGLSHLMKVHAEPTAATVTGNRVSFSGPGFLIMDGKTKMPIHVSVWADVATQKFRLAVVELAAKGIMPEETMQTGHFELR
jgi:hypothetical protein